MTRHKDSPDRGHTAEVVGSRPVLPTATIHEDWPGSPLWGEDSTVVLAPEFAPNELSVASPRRATLQLVRDRDRRRNCGAGAPRGLEGL
jgi:hypothetical protein